MIYFWGEDVGTQRGRIYSLFVWPDDVPVKAQILKEKKNTCRGMKAIFSGRRRTVFTSEGRRYRILKTGIFGMVVDLKWKTKAGTEAVAKFFKRLLEATAPSVTSRSLCPVGGAALTAHQALWVQFHWFLLQHSGGSIHHFSYTLHYAAKVLIHLLNSSLV